MTEQPDLRARDIWKSLPHRRTLGDRILSRVGGRGFAPPRFASGRKLFVRLGLPDPWDPDAPRDADIALGDIGVPQHRAPTPHLMPKEQAKPAAAAKIPHIPGLPPPTPREPAAGKAAPAIGATRKDDTAELRAKMLAKEKAATEAFRQARATPTPLPPGVSPQALKPIPVRPDLETAMAKKGAPASTASTAASAAGMVGPRGMPGRPLPARPDLVRSGPDARPEPASPARPADPRPASGMIRPARMNMEPSRRPVSMPSEPEVLEPEVLEPAAPAAPIGDVADLFGTGGGGWEVRKLPAGGPPVEAARAPEPGDQADRAAAPAAPAPSTVSAPPAPSTVSAPPATAPMPAAPAAPPEAPRAVPSEIGAARAVPSEIGAARPRPPGQPAPPSRKPPGGGGLDDLFASTGETRVRMPKAPAEGEAMRPRRPMVSSPEELQRLGLDRRPPPAKPPDVPKPPPSASAATEPEEPPE